MLAFDFGQTEVKPENGSSAAEPLLQVPPFPGARPLPFARRSNGASTPLSDSEVDGLIALVRTNQVGGRYWTDASDPTSVIDVGVNSDAGAVREQFRTNVFAFDYFDPFDGGPISFAEAVELCAFWKRMIDFNRSISAAMGFAFWKQRTVAPLLWRGDSAMPFLADASAVGVPDRVAVWKARTPAPVLRELERRDVELIEVEDGFIRSTGLGADCVPPLSITLDSLGVHFDPGRPSDLERLLQEEPYSEQLLERARRLRRSIVASGVSKYSTGLERLERRSDRRHILVPGQVEDDRAVLSGGAFTSNVELLRSVRSSAPDAYILYKPHPDVEAGHRAGAIPGTECLGLADEIVRDEPISALLELADEVHVNSSLAGFEALLRDKPVTTYGAPFYAGWGLTTDLGPIPARRTRRLAIDELVAGALLLYPRYLDPVTGLPCPPEILVRRLSSNDGRKDEGLVVRLRRLQGRCKRTMLALAGRR